MFGVRLDYPVEYFHRQLYLDLLEGFVWPQSLTFHHNRFLLFVTFLPAPPVGDPTGPGK